MTEIIEKQSVSDQQIIDCLNTNYEIKVNTLTFLPLGADINASLYKVQSHDKLSYFVKLKHGHHDDISVTLQLMLYRTGIQEIISPLTTKYGLPTHHIDNFTLIVYPFIEGQNGFSQDLTNNQWIILGKALRQVHEFNLPSPIKGKIKQESYSKKWREAVRSMYAHIDNKQTVTDEIALKLLKFMKEHRKKIEQLVNQAEQLCKKIQEKSAKFVLCHSDIHAGNVLIQKDGTIYIVDWDSPIMAPKERDLMFIGGGVGNVWNNPYEKELFYKGYGKVKINKNILAYYQHERIVEDIAVYSQQLFLTTDGGKDRELMYKHFINMFEPQGVVEITLRTNIEI